MTETIGRFGWTPGKENAGKRRSALQTLRQEGASPPVARGTSGTPSAPPGRTALGVRADPSTSGGGPGGTVRGGCTRPVEKAV